MGWIYYLPLGLGPMSVLWRLEWRTVAALLLFMVPFSALTLATTPWAVRTLGSAYLVGFGLLWWAHANDRCA
jgi:hypothetical protein